MISQWTGERTNCPIKGDKQDNRQPCVGSGAVSCIWRCCSGLGIIVWMKGIFWGYYTVGNDVILIVRLGNTRRTEL